MRQRIGFFRRCAATRRTVMLRGGSEMNSPFPAVCKTQRYRRENDVKISCCLRKLISRKLPYAELPVGRARTRVGRTDFDFSNLRGAQSLRIPLPRSTGWASLLTAGSTSPLASDFQQLDFSAFPMPNERANRLLNVAAAAAHSSIAGAASPLRLMLHASEVVRRVPAGGRFGADGCFGDQLFFHRDRAQ